MTIDLQGVYSMRTIVFLTDVTENSLSFGAVMQRTVGLSDDYDDTSTNTVLP